MAIMRAKSSAHLPLTRGNGPMRKGLLVAAIVGFMHSHAWAQAAEPPGTPPFECQQLLDMRNELERDAKAIKDANRQKASELTTCKLFRTWRPKPE